eukprot:4304959-Ditylum_brightwellii.AAC.1
MACYGCSMGIRLFYAICGCAISGQGLGAVYGWSGSVSEPCSVALFFSQLNADVVPMLCQYSAVGCVWYWFH